MPYRDLEKRRANATRNRPKYARSKLARKLNRKYGITIEERDRMISVQKHCCAICGKKRKLVVDHCHSTGVVRGMLCDGCNTAIAVLERDTGFLHAAWAYLAKTTSRPPGQLSTPPGGPVR